MGWASKRKNMDNKGKECKMENCNSMAKSKGYCIKCYNKYYRKGERRKDI